MASNDESSTGASQKRIARLFDVTEAQIVMENLPTDFSDLTDEEPDSDPEEPDYEPDLIPSTRPPDRLAIDESSSDDDFFTEKNSTQTCRGELQHNWRKRPISKKDRGFNKHEGPVEEMFLDCHTPGSFFMKFFNADIIDNIVFQTNLYVQHRQRRISPITRSDLLAFIGINCVMGYHILPSYTLYWNNDKDLNVSVVSEAMTRDKFSQMLSNIHVNDNMNLNPADKLSKVRPLIEQTNIAFSTLYDPKKIQSIDESMILFKGRSSLKQYNPMKPIKRGYKLWMRADDDGYISKFDVYQGKGGEREKFSEFGLGESVVLTMMEDLFGQGHEIYFDNFFSSVRLFDFLTENNISACGTIRSNRKGLPSLAKDKDLTRGQFDYRTSDDLSVYVWKDNKSVHVMSNHHGTETSSVLRTQKDTTRIEISCPTAIKDYNQHMGGVDKADMFCSLYGLNRKSRKWWHRIFFGILDRIIVNAFIVFNKMDSRMKLLNFRRLVASHLLAASKPPVIGRPLSNSCSPANPTKRRKVDYSVKPDIRLTNRGIHWPVYSEKRGRCEVCSRKKIESRPHFQCSHCQIFLCLNDKKQCFLEFHDMS